MTSARIEAASAPYRQVEDPLEGRLEAIRELERRAGAEEGTWGRGDGDDA